MALPQDEWRERAYCRLNVVPNEAFFIDGDGGRPDPRGMKACGLCVVRTECLAAGKRDRMYGLWGGQVLREGIPLTIERQRRREAEQRRLRVVV
jgi:hypothetical protein